MSNNYNILATHITNKYMDRISGRDLGERIVGEDPAKRVMVGKLAEGRVEKDFQGQLTENPETRFKSVPSLGLSFAVKKSEVGSLNIIPQGLLFYSVVPTYDEVVAYILNLYSEKDGKAYCSIEELCELYSTEKFYIPSVYKKIDIEKQIKEPLQINLNGIGAGKYDLNDDLAAKLEEVTDSVLAEARIVIEKKISFADLLTQEKFESVLEVKDEAICPRWRIEIPYSVSLKADEVHFFMQMVNQTPKPDGNQNIGYILSVFSTGLRVIGDNVEFLEVAMENVKYSFKEKTPVYAIAENTSAIFDEETNEIRTENIPLYTQFRLITKDKYDPYITFEKLLSDPVNNLSYILNEMKKDYEKRVAEFEAFPKKNPVQVELFSDSLESYKQEISRFERGIEHIKYKDDVKKAFSCMNKTFQLQIGKGTRNIVGWRLFQIVFIVSMIEEVIYSEYKSDPTIKKASIETANLLYFPTGGGKTEAFLGTTVFAMFFDRFRGKEIGVTSILKYPLRLLAVQQLDRVLSVTIKANIIKKSVSEIAHTNDFSVGFYVGSGNTPNKIDNMTHLSERGDKSSAHKGFILESDEATLNDYYRFIDVCPFCGERTVNIRFNKDNWCLEHVCDNPGCELHTLPIHIVDNEIYRYLPSIVISIIDKMAIVGISKEFKMLFGQVTGISKKHGLTCGGKCMCGDSKCNELIQPVTLKDPIPTLIIQDEMHLVKESLGTFDSHYESFINYYCNELVPDEHKKQIRFVGATATISMYQNHIRNLYHMEGRRFPCEYPSVKSGEDFYSYTNKNDISRLIMGYAPYGRSITDGMWESVYLMRVVIYSLMRNLKKTHEVLRENGFDGDELTLKNMLYDYWIELVYNNRKQDASELHNAFQNQANNFLEKQNTPLFSIEEMTSDTDFQTVRKTLFDIQANRMNLEHTNLLLATSTISHGVDEDSFNIMYFFGMPNDNAEYIQAYSRTGRKYTGIVIDIIRLMKIRDRSYLKNFNVFHHNKDELVESVPINRWAQNAIYSTLPGLLNALILQYYAQKLNIEDPYKAMNIKKILQSNAIDKDEVAEILIEAYGCMDSEKLSLAYKEIIIEEVRSILNGIENGVFQNKDFFSQMIGKYSKGGKTPMRSLRDTEESVVIEVKG